MTDAWIAAAQRLRPHDPEPQSDTLWVYGVHGGSGESRIAALEPSWSATDHSWPDRPGAAVLLVARTSAYGLNAAHAAIAKWAAGRTPGSAALVGLVLVADAPGRLPKPLHDLAKLVAGGVERSWRIGWSEHWRQGDFAVLPAGVDRLLKDLR